MKTFFFLSLLLFSMAANAQYKGQWLENPSDTFACDPRATAYHDLLHQSDTLWHFAYWENLQNSTVSYDTVISRQHQNVSSDTIPWRYNLVLHRNSEVLKEPVSLVTALPWQYISSTVFCGVDSLTLKYPYPHSGYTYQWVQTGSNRTLSTSGFYTVTKASADSFHKVRWDLYDYPIYVRVTDKFGCSTISNWNIRLFNAEYPVAPSICLLTVDSLLHNIITIEKPDFPVDSIRIEKFKGNKWIYLATVKKKNLLQVIDFNSNAAMQTSTYRATAYKLDSCWLISRSTTGAPHTSVLLQISRNSFNQYNLSWTKYEGLPDSQLLGYYILKGTSYSNLQPYDTTMSILNSNWNDVKDSNAETSYVYVVEAIRKDGCDYSAHLKRSQAAIRSNPVNTKSLVINIVPVKQAGLEAKIIGNRLYTNSQASVNIYQSDGKLVHTESVNGSADLQLGKGLWIIQVGNFNGMKTFKVIKG